MRNSITTHYTTRRPSHLPADKDLPLEFPNRRERRKQAAIARKFDCMSRKSLERLSRLISRNR